METIIKIKDARMLTQGQAAEVYFKNNPVSTGKLNKLKAEKNAGLTDGLSLKMLILSILQKIFFHIKNF